MWGIQDFNFIYYFLFQVVIIPFAIIIDILCYNVDCYYNGLKFLNFFDLMKSIYQNRTKDWSGHETADFKVPYNYRDLMKFAFSPQLYFVQTMSVSGTMMVIFGFQGIINNQINPFEDSNLIVFVALNMIFMFLFQKIFLYLYSKVSLWKVKNEKESDLIKSFY